MALSNGSTRGGIGTAFVMMSRIRRVCAFTSGALIDAPIILGIVGAEEASSKIGAGVSNPSLRALMRGAALCAVFGLSACAVGLPERITRLAPAEISPALDVLAIDYERTTYNRGAQVSGFVANEQRRTRVATPSAGRLRNEAVGPIPTEVRIDVDRMTTDGNQVTVRGTLVLRDLAFGTILAERKNFSAGGSFPTVSSQSFVGGLVFRGVEDEILDWIATLDCNTRERFCAPDLAPEAEPVEAVEEPVEPGSDLVLDQMVRNRPGGSLTKLVGGAIDPGQVIAAAQPPVRATAPAAMSQIGTTVAALGLLSRSGFWLQTPLVSEESAGEVRDPSSDRRLPVSLVPKDGPAGGGSQISLAALNELGLDATALVTLEVFR